MYVILIYDVGTERVGKMLKLCREYLHWIQNSVLEGELTEAQLRELRARIEELIKKNRDSVIIFQSREERWLKKEVIGEERGSTDIFI